METEIETDDKFKVFVGGLAWRTTQRRLRKYFSRFGYVHECVVARDFETGLTYGFGFVTFSNLRDVDIVIRGGPYRLDGRMINARAYIPSTKKKPKRKGGLAKPFIDELPSNVTDPNVKPVSD